jgi:hypothetical protein
MRRPVHTVLASIAAAALVAGCGRSSGPEEAHVRVADVDLGLGLRPDQRVTDMTETFTPKETIYLSVVMEGKAPSATVKARWTYENGIVVEESSKTIAPVGQKAVAAFHVSKPEGLPRGSYNVQVFVDGRPVESESFQVV